VARVAIGEAGAHEGGDPENAEHRSGSVSLGDEEEKCDAQQDDRELDHDSIIR